MRTQNIKIKFTQEIKMKNVSLCFVINSVHQGKKILYRIPPCISDDNGLESLQDSSEKKLSTAESLMEIFHKNTNICKFKQFFPFLKFESWLHWTNFF